MPSKGKAASFLNMVSGGFFVCLLYIFLFSQDLYQVIGETS